MWLGNDTIQKKALPMTTPKVDFSALSGLSRSWKTARILLFFFFLYIVFRAIVVFVPAGFAGAVYDRGRGVLPGSLREGMNVVIPFWQSVVLFDTRIQEYTMSAVRDEGAIRKDDSLDAPTSDGQQVKVDVTVLFHLAKEDVPYVYQKIGPNYVDKLVRPYTRSQVRMVISRYSAPAIYSESRQEAEQIMTRELTELLAPQKVTIDKELLRAVYFSPEYSSAIENKVIAEQRVKQAEFEVLEAKQRAEAKIAEAKGLAEAQALQKASLTQEYLQLEAIKKWNGILPQYNSGTLPFLNLPVR